MKFNKSTLLSIILWGVIVVIQSKVQCTDLKDEYLELETSIIKAERAVQQNLEKDKSNSTRVIVLGVTGSGKSTLVHSLAGKNLEAKKGIGSYSVDVPNGEDHLEGFKIGGGLGSVTREPTAWIDEKNNLTYWDCPGFMDSKGAAQDIVNAFAIDQLFKPPSRIKIVLTFQERDFEGDRGNAAIDRLYVLATLLPETDQLMKGTCLVITKKQNDEFGVEDKILGLLNNIEVLKKEKPEEYKIREKENAFSFDLLTTLMKNSRIFSFPKPEREGPYSFGDRQKLINILKKDPLVNPPCSSILNMNNEKVFVYMGNLWNRFGNTGKFIAEFIDQSNKYNNEYRRKVENRIISENAIESFQKTITEFEMRKVNIGGLLAKLQTINSLEELIYNYKLVFKDEEILTDDQEKKAKRIDNFVNFVKRSFPLSFEEIKPDVLKPSLNNMINDLDLLIKRAQSQKNHVIKMQEVNTKLKEGQIKQEKADEKIKLLKEEFNKTDSALKETQSKLDSAKEDAKREIERAIKNQETENERKISELKKQLEEAKTSLSKAPLKQSHDSSDLVTLIKLLSLLPSGCGGGGNMGTGTPFIGGGMPSCFMPSEMMMPQHFSPSGSGRPSISTRSGGNPRSNMVYVSGYTRSNGTKVAPYYRAGPTTKH